MMNDTLQALHQVIMERRDNPQEGSYTSYLFEKGLDKVLKKVGEETSETIIAAKNGNNVELAEELCDLVYHLLVLMVERDLPLAEVETRLEVRRQKTGNLKPVRETDKNS